MSEAFNDLDMALRDKVFLEKGEPININHRPTLQKIYSSFTDSDSGLEFFFLKDTRKGTSSR